MGRLAFSCKHCENCYNKDAVALTERFCNPNPLSHRPMGGGSFFVLQSGTNGSLCHHFANILPQFFRGKSVI